MATILQCVSATLLVLQLAVHSVHGQVLQPPTNQTVPNNIAENVTYACTLPPNPALSLLWEVDNLQINTENIALFNERGIFVENDTTLVFIEQALNDSGREYQVQCLSFNSLTLTTSPSPPVFVRVFGPPDPVVNLDVIPFSETSVLITWGRPPATLSDVFLDYIITITTESTVYVNVTSDLSLEVAEGDRECEEYEFTVRARNAAGASDTVSIRESIPISPDLSLTDSSLSILSVDVSSPSAAEITVAFQRATSCSTNFNVRNHSVVVMSEEGEEVRRVMADSASNPLRVTVGALPRDAVLTVRVEACNVLICRRSRTLDLLTTDVQTASALFFETFVFLNCTFGSGSLARGCVFTLQLEEEEGEQGEIEGGSEGEGEEVGREVFWVRRENGSAVSSSQCNRTENSRNAYQVIVAADWESDGTVSPNSIPVTDNVTDDVEQFPCPTEGGSNDDGELSGGAIAGIVIGVTLFVLLVMSAIVFTVVFCYHRTRDVKKKSNGAISIEERSLLPSAGRRNVTSLGASPAASLPVASSRSTDSSAYESNTMMSTSSLPVHSLQSSLDCGPVGELSIPSGKKRGKIHMQIWSDSLDRCKKTGKKTFQLLPLLEDQEPPPEISEI